MIDPERIRRLVAKMGDRKDALEFVRQMRCGGKKYGDGGDSGQVRDNTRVSSVIPLDVGYVPAMERPLPMSLGNARLDSGVSGVLPFVGDALQGWQAIRDFKNHDWVAGMQTAGLLFAPNIIEKPLKGIFSSPFKDYKHVFDRELFKEIEQGAYRDVLAGRAPSIPLPKESLGRVMDMPEDVKRVLWNSTLPRLKASHPDIDVDAIWNREMARAKYTEYPAETYANAGEAWAAGHYSPDTGNIGMKEGSPRIAVLPHEGRHRLDAKIPLTEDESGMLGDAFGQEFLDLPNTVPELKGYNSILKDEVTTNADARMKLLGEMHSQRTSPELQNKIIAKKTDEQVVKAVEESNFYGRKLIESLRASGKLTPERINKFRIAMQKVPTVAGIGYLGNALYNGYKEQETQDNKYPNGGKFFRTSLQNESPMMYQPMKPWMPDVSVPMRFIPDPDLGDYVPPSSTGMAENYPVTVSVPSPRVDLGFVAPEIAEDAVDLFSDEAKARRRLKQRYAESRFNNKAVSKAGAQGAWQIMPITLKDYLGRGRGKAGDLNDPEYNGKIRDWVMGIIPRDLQEFWSDDDSDINKLAKLYAAYNWGAGSLRNYLRKRQKAGKSIDDPYEWVEDLNPETRRYVKYLAFDEDIPDSSYTNTAFEDAARSRGYMAEGGRLYGMGGPKKWIKNAISGKIAKEMSEYSKGFLSVDEAKTILEHPDDYASYLGWDDKKIDELKKNFYNNFSPWGYDLLSGLDALTGGEGQEYPLGTSLSEKMARDYLIANYLGIPEKDRKEPLASRMYEQSPYKPTIGSSDSKEYIRYSTDYNRNKIVDIYNGLMSNMKGVPGWKSEIKPGKEYWTSYLDSPYSVTVGKSGKNLAVSHRGTYDFNIDPYSAALGQYTLGYGTDAERGDYISVYDKWDLNPFNLGSAYNLPKKLIKTFASLGDASGGFGNPINFYDRVYLDDYYGVNSSPQNPDEFYGGYIIPATITAERKANGGKIRIKPENRGKFNALLKRTGKSASWFKEHGTPLQRKRATFALNARKWKHGDGGPIDRYSPEQIRAAIAKLKGTNK